ncbi:neurofilament light polypeptide [Triplophysa dalaica]|uniref:neurofilament light polypeptide n=1 Tax=Triplophysa dalaica TaxID=1582913 RepID=UPI0024DF7653|nr:neurofilament light polypeptide [Triplophysa dalaica]XP_056587249.1 neurofilament light polypeptide [Triplophysa dalaica]XP_056587250.1 neurofilament light polypeptide [Triplophysa dalaica]
MSAVGFDPFFSSSYKRWYAESSPRVSQRGRSRTTFSSHPPSLPSARHHYASPGRTSASLLLSSPGRSMDIDLSHAAQVSSEFRVVRTHEKAQLQDLNDRFAGYIERVHELEQQNRALEAELLLLRQRHVEPSRLRGLYEQEIRTLRAAVEEARMERQAALSHRESMEDALRSLQAGYEREVEGREDAEGRLLEARKEADDNALAQAEQEKKVDTLLNELAFLKKVHEGEISELQAQIQYGAQIAIEAETTKPDLSSALRDIRSQYEKLAAKNIQSAEEWFRSKMGNLTESVAHHSDAMRSSKDEAGEYRRQLQACVLEIDACRGLNESLEKELREVEDKQSAEIAAMQDTINDLEDELRATKGEMARYLKEYQDLLNVKMALDIEIAAYRKLLEGEESRFNVGMGGLGGAYSVGPVYSRPMFSMSSGTPYLLGCRFVGTSYSADEAVTSSQAQQAEASPTHEGEEEEEKEEEEKEVEEEQKEEEEKEEDEATKEDEEGGEQAEEKEDEAKQEEKGEEEEGAEEKEEVKGGDEEEGEEKEGEGEEEAGEQKEGEVKGDEKAEEEGADKEDTETGKSEEKADTTADTEKEETKTVKDKGESETKKEKSEPKTEKAKDEVKPEPAKEKAEEKTESVPEPQSVKDKPKEEPEKPKAKEKAEPEKAKGKDEGEKDKSEKKESVKQEKGKEETDKPKGKK